MATKVIEKSCATSEVKEKIFVHVLNGDAGGFRYAEFYTIDLSKGQVSECPYALLTDTGFNSMVSLGSIIYVVGARRPEFIMCQTKPPHSGCTKKGHYHKVVSYLDLANDTGDGWKDAPGLSSDPSQDPAVLTLGGKIYLFPRWSHESDTAQVFDPISNKWEPLLPPPSVGFFDINYTTSAIADSQNNRILVHFEHMQSVFAYYPANNQWELILEHFSWSSTLVFLDGVLYFYLPECPKFVAAYHVATKQWLKIVFTSKLSKRIWRCEYNAMFHLGSDLMCLAAYCSVYSPRGTHVKLTKFRFERSPHNPSDLLITLLPDETYTIGACYLVHRFLPI